MNKPKSPDDIIKQALLLDTAERTLFIENIADQEIKKQVEFILSDETAVTQFLLKTGIGVTELGHSSFSDIETGTKINRITIEQLIGKGGMGSVYLGYDDKLKRQVAVKSIRPEFVTKESTQKRFIREAQILSQINHPAICQIYDYIETKLGDFLILEYIKGQHLWETSLTFEEKIDALINLASALVVAHEQGIIHRDLKPDNILITESGEVKILDFGIAQSIDKKTDPIGSSDSQAIAKGALTQQGILLGTIRYMSPEQANGDTIHTASDIYSLGIIAQELLSGKPAYQKFDTDELLSEVKKANVLPANDLPRGLLKLIRETTQVSPELRPTAQSVVKELTAIKNAPKLRKRKKRFMFMALALTAIVFAFFITQWKSFETKEVRLKIESEYQTEINRMAQSRELVYLLPIHNIEPEEQQFDALAESIIQRIEQDPKLDLKQKQRLKGQVFLETGKYQEAVDLLEQSSSNHTLLARAWKNLYLEKIADYRYSQGDSKGEEAQLIRTKYLTPALKYIELQTTKDDVLEAFKLVFTSSLDDALVILNQVIANQNWNNEAFKLKASVLNNLYFKASEQGNWDKSKEYLELAAETYINSIERARSYPDSYFKLCNIYYVLLSDGIQRTGVDVEKYADFAINTCENLLILYPQNVKAMTTLSDIYMMKSQWDLSVGADATEAITKAEQWIKSSQSISKTFQSVWSEALIHTVGGLAKIKSGDNPSEKITQARNSYLEAIAYNTEAKPFVYGDLLYTYIIEAKFQKDKNIKLTPLVKQAENHFNEALQIENLDIHKIKALYANMGTIYTLSLNQNLQQGADINEQGVNLIKFYQNATNKIKNEPNLLLFTANTYLIMATFNHEKGKDFQELLTNASLYINQAIDLYPNNYEILKTKADILSLEATSSHHDFSETNDAFNRAVEANPKSHETYLSWAESYWHQAQLSQDTNQRLALIDQGIEKANMAWSLNQSDPAVQQILEILNSQSKL